MQDVLDKAVTDVFGTATPPKRARAQSPTATRR